MHDRASNFEARKLLELARSCLQHAHIPQTEDGRKVLMELGDQYFERAKRLDPNIKLND
jgi:hypothetical protein